MSDRFGRGMRGGGQLQMGSQGPYFHGRLRPPAQVHAVGASRQGDVDPVVHVQPGAPRGGDGAQGARQVQQGPGVEILLAQLDGDRAGGAAGALQRARLDLGQRTAIRRPPVGDQIDPRDTRGHSIRPPRGDEAFAYSLRPMRPARNALRPATTPSRIASAIRTGSFASTIAVFISTPWQPSSIATAASNTVPTPASTMTGTFARSRMMRML